MEAFKCDLTGAVKEGVGISVAKAKVKAGEFHVVFYRPTGPASQANGVMCPEGEARVVKALQGEFGVPEEKPAK